MYHDNRTDPRPKFARRPVLPIAGVPTTSTIAANSARPAGLNSPTAYSGTEGLVIIIAALIVLLCFYAKQTPNLETG